MKIKLLMENNNLYVIDWTETVDDFEQKVTFSDGNAFLLTNNGVRVSIKKIVEWSITE